MKVFIAVDLEGVCGVVHETDTDPAGRGYPRARTAMLADLQAVLDGCRVAGADEIVVCDAHNDGGNLDPDAMPVGVTLTSGAPAPGSMMEGIGPGFDAALFVGYHARAGTRGAVLEHTWTYRVFGVSVGGIEVGEFGLGAMLAGHHGVPAVYVSGDDKTAAEARALVPGITATVVKRGIMRTSAALVPPDEARALIRADAEAALAKASGVAPLEWPGDPLLLTFTRVPFCDAASAYPGARRIDGRTLEIGGDDFATLYHGFLACVDLAYLVAL
jgi:D-amino peptidase